MHRREAQLAAADAMLAAAEEHQPGLADEWRRHILVSSCRSRRPLAADEPWQQGVHRGPARTWAPCAPAADCLAQDIHAPRTAALLLSAWHTRPGKSIACCGFARGLRCSCGQEPTLLAHTLLQASRSESERCLGSGPGGRPMCEGPFCCNNDIFSGITPCDRAADPAVGCSRCGLVSYCSAACRASHAARHARACQSRLAEDPFVPSYLLEGRRPSWVSDMTPLMDFTRRRKQEYVWGNMPAYCLLPAALVDAARGGSQLLAAAARGGPPTSSAGAAASTAGPAASASSGGTGQGSAAAPHELHLLLPASGDLRYVIKSINGLQLCGSGADGSSGSAGDGPRYRVHVHLNDGHPKVAMRNLLVLLLLGAHGEDAADAAAALIYSTAMTQKQYTALLDCGLGTLVAKDRPGASEPASRLPKAAIRELMVGRGFGRLQQACAAEALAEQLGQGLHLGGGSAHSGCSGGRGGSGTAGQGPSRQGAAGTPPPADLKGLLSHPYPVRCAHSSTVWAFNFSCPRCWQAGFHLPWPNASPPYPAPASTQVRDALHGRRCASGCRPAR